MGFDIGNLVSGAVDGLEKTVSGVANDVGNVVSGVVQEAGQLASNPLVDTAIGSLVGMPELGSLGSILGDLTGAAGAGQAGGISGLLGNFGNLLGGGPPVSSGFPGNILGGIGDIFGPNGPFGGGIGLPQINPPLPATEPNTGDIPATLGGFSGGNVTGGSGGQGGGGGLPGISNQLSQLQQLDNYSEGVQLAIAREQVRHKLADKILDAMAQA